MTGFDPEILQDFLTEAGELLDELEGDLVSLEQTPEDPDLLNQVFRALHTIKGSASFLAFTNLVEVAHAAETALNAARNGTVVVDRAAMDLLLRAVDLVKEHMDQIRAGEALTTPDAALVSGLVALGEGGSTPEPAPGPEPVSDAGVPESSPDGSTTTPLNLDASKMDLLEFLVADLDQTLVDVRRCVAALGVDETRAGAVAELGELSDSLARSVDFFEYEAMTRLARLLQEVAESITQVDPDQMPQLTARLHAVMHLLDEQSTALAGAKMIDRPIDTLCARIEALLAGEGLPEDALAVSGAAAEELLALDGVVLPSTGAPAQASAAPARAVADAPELKIAQDPGPRSAPEQSAQESDKGEAPVKRGTAVEQTIRVEVGRLETLMNLVGELVLQKNIISALTRQVGAHSTTPQDLRESIMASAGHLDRVTGDIQTAVMRTRMQPLDKLFGKYPRLIRDLAGKTKKKINLVIEGGDTEVDKSVIEELGDPLVHLLRNSADHGVEMPETRLAAGKPETGEIRLVASHEGSHVQVLIIDDGKGLSREKLGAKAIERGLTTEGELAQLSDREVFRFIFGAGFSTAEQLSDLSGRGVGMDVVRTNIEKLKGTVDVDSQEGKGTTISIIIPLTVAILPAMLVGVGSESYAIPLSNILEIVRPDAEQLSTIREHPVMRLRDTVLPLLDSRDMFDVHGSESVPVPFAVVLAQNEKRLGLMVTRLIGQQEIVVKPLDPGTCKASGPISGATVRDDGSVSLIVDVAQVFRLAENRTLATAA